MQKTVVRTLFHSLNKLLLILFVAGLVSCVTPVPAPVDEYALARAAYDAAGSVFSLKYAPALWQEAEEDYQKASAFYKSQDYKSAKEFFIKARKGFEKAENTARYHRAKNGEVF